MRSHLQCCTFLSNQPSETEYDHFLEHEERHRTLTHGLCRNASLFQSHVDLWFAMDSLWDMSAWDIKRAVHGVTSALLDEAEVEVSISDINAELNTQTELLKRSNLGVPLRDRHES